MTELVPSTPQPPFIFSLSQESFHSSHSSSLLPQLLDHLSFFHSFQSFPELPPEFHSFLALETLQSLEPALETLQSDGPLQSPPEVPDQSLSCSWKNQVLLHKVESVYIIITYIITTHSIYQYMYHISYIKYHISNLIYHISYIIYIYLVYEHTEIYIYIHAACIDLFVCVYTYTWHACDTLVLKPAKPLGWRVNIYLDGFSTDGPYPTNAVCLYVKPLWRSQSHRVPSVSVERKIENILEFQTQITHLILPEVTLCYNLQV